MGMKRNGRRLEVFGSFCNSGHVKIPRGIARQFCRYSAALISKCSVNGHVTPKIRDIKDQYFRDGT